MSLNGIFYLSPAKKDKGLDLSFPFICLLFFSLQVDEFVLTLIEIMPENIIRNIYEQVMTLPFTVSTLKIRLLLYGTVWGLVVKETDTHVPHGLMKFLSYFFEALFLTFFNSKLFVTVTVCHCKCFVFYCQE